MSQFDKNSADTNNSPLYPKILESDQLLDDKTPLQNVDGKDHHGELLQPRADFEFADDFTPVQIETTDPAGDENVVRGNWSHKADFLLSLLGYAVGLTNVWRFPYICYRNGGGAFLIAYWTFMACSGLPLFFLEVALGQFTSKSALSIWSLSPMLKGVGCATIIVTVLITTYYEVLMAYIVFYFTQSLTLGDLPWKYCGNPWNTENCLDYNNHTLRGNTQPIMVVFREPKIRTSEKLV